MTYLFIFLIGIVVYLVAIKHDFMHPVIYFSLPWILCIGTYVFDIYDINNQTSAQAIQLILFGICGFLFGTLLIQRPMFQFIADHNLTSRKIIPRTWLLNFAVIFTALFNFSLALITINYIRQGVSYSVIRDLLYSYSSDGSTFFHSSLLLNLYNLVDAPLTYCVAPIAVIELFRKHVSGRIRALAWVSVGAYIFATGGRLIVMFLLFQFIFVIGFYRLKVPRKVFRRIFILVLVLGAAAIATTFFRVKVGNIGATKVNSVYAYFNVNLPLLSRWMPEVDANNIHGYGMGFMGGLFQLVNRLVGLLGGSLPAYTHFSTVTSVPQTSWVQVYPGNWYNAFVTTFYDFYADFRMPGVIIESALLGVLSKCIYVLVRYFRDEKYLPVALVMVEVLTSTFFRWQLGTFTFAGAFFVSFFLFEKSRARLDNDGGELEESINE